MATSRPGLASLGGLSFRIGPSDVRWNFQIDTRVVDTVGGRVVQIIGSTLSDITITGFYGEDRNIGASKDSEPGRSWRMADAFVRKVQDLMEAQSKDSRKSGQVMQAPLRFLYPPKGWDFSVYIKSITDPDGGGSVQHRTGKFSHQYAITLFIVEDLSVSPLNVNGSNGVIAQKGQQAIRDYIARVSNGIGWKPGPFNDPFFRINPTTGEITQTEGLEGGIETLRERVTGVAQP